jgi:hypothetical protein
MTKSKNIAEQPLEGAAAAVSVEALQAEIVNLKEQLEIKEKEFDALRAEFEQYKADAQEILAEAGKTKLVISDMPLLEVDGELFTFKMSRFTLDGKYFTAEQIIANPGAYEKEIGMLIDKYKILKPFKPKEV